jgi:hypothetical protein
MAAARVVRVLVEDLLKGNLTVQLSIQGHKDGSQSAASMRAEDTEPLAVAGNRAYGVTGGALGVGLGVVLSRSSADAGQSALDVRVA